MPDTTEPQVADEVIQLLVAMSARLNQHFAAKVAEFGLSTAEGKVLLALDPGESQSMRAIARKLGYDASNLTGVIDKLEDRGAVQRCPDPLDRRVKAIIATEHGQSLSRRLAQRLREDSAPVRALSEAQLRELGALLHAAMDGDPGR